MEPQFESSGAYFANSTSAPSLAVPAGVQAGDVLVGAFYIDGLTTTITAMSSGFAHAEDSPVTAAAPFNHNLVIVVKRATGADSGSYVFTLSGSTYVEGQIHRYSGVQPSGDILDPGADSATDAGSSTSTPSVQVTTAGPERTVLHAATCWAGGTWTPPTGFTKRQQGGGAALVTLSDEAQAVAGATGSLVATVSNADKRAAWAGALISAATTAEGTADAGLGLAVSASGASAHEGTADAGLGLAVAAAGTRPSSGVVALTLGLALAGTGARDADGTSGLGLNLALNSQGPGGLCVSVPVFPGACETVGTFPGACVPVPLFSEVQP